MRDIVNLDNTHVFSIALFVCVSPRQLVLQLTFLPTAFTLPEGQWLAHRVPVLHTSAVAWRALKLKPLLHTHLLMPRRGVSAILMEHILLSAKVREFDCARCKKRRIQVHCTLGLCPSVAVILQAFSKFREHLLD